MNFYPIYKNKKLLPWIKWWLIKGNKVMPKHLSEWINSAEAITLTGVYKGSPLLNLNLNGNTSQTEVPSPEAPVPVNVVKGNNTIKINDTDYQVKLKSKNLLNVKDITRTDVGINLVSITNNVVHWEGTATSTYPTTGNQPFKLSHGTYTISTTNNSYDFFVWFRNSSGTTLFSATLNKGTKTINITNDDVTQIVLGVEHLIVGNTYNIETCFQIEEAESATTYEPYYDYELCKIGDYQDVIYKEANKWYVDKYVGKVVLNGSESGWTFTTNGNAWFISGWANSNNAKIPANNDTLSGSLSNYFINVARSQLASVTQGIGIASSGAINLKHPDFIGGQLSSFTTWLSTHNTTVYYVLSTSTTSEITETNLINQLEAIYNAKLQSGTNTIMQLPSDLPFYLNFQYYEKG